MCEECGQRPATVFLTKSMNGERTEARLCTQCAIERGEIGPLMQSPGWLLEQFLASLGAVGPAGAALGGGSARPDAGRRMARRGEPFAPAAQRCPACGLDYAQFARTGLLGCAECYTSFRVPLGPALRRLHGAATHVGARPEHEPAPSPEAEPAARTGAAAAAGTAAREASASQGPEPGSIEELRARLREAVREERFEEAARLRDEIRRREEA